MKPKRELEEMEEHLKARLDGMDIMQMGTVIFSALVAMDVALSENSPFPI